MSRRIANRNNQIASTHQRSKSIQVIRDIETCWHKQPISSANLLRQHGLDGKSILHRYQLNVWASQRVNQFF
jgi:hypothetical protein